MVAFGKIDIYLSIGLLALYTVFVLTIVIQSKQKVKISDEEREDLIKAAEFTKMIDYKKEVVRSASHVGKK